MDAISQNGMKVNDSFVTSQGFNKALIIKKYNL